MKRIEIIIGSPRKKGNTWFLSQQLKKLLKCDNVISGISYLYDYEIKPCADCRACKKGELKCILKDEADIIMDKIENSDIFIIGTPIYWFGPTAKTKLFIDRLRPYFVSKKLKGKKAALILPAGSGEADCDLTIEMFKRIFSSLEVEFIGYVTSKSYDKGDSEKDKTALSAIRELSKKIFKNRFNLNSRLRDN